MLAASPMFAHSPNHGCLNNYPSLMAVNTMKSRWSLGQIRAIHSSSSAEKLELWESWARPFCWAACWLWVSWEAWGFDTSGAVRQRVSLAACVPSYPSSLRISAVVFSAIKLFGLIQRVGRWTRSGDRCVPRQQTRPWYSFPSIDKDDHGNISILL